LESQNPYWPLSVLSLGCLPNIKVTGFSGVMGFFAGIAGVAVLFMLTTTPLGICFAQWR
jgi:hypothetical protein